MSKLEYKRAEIRTLDAAEILEAMGPASAGTWSGGDDCTWVLGSCV